MYLFRRITLYLIEAHQPNFFDNLPVETHFGVNSLAKYPARYPHSKEQFHGVEGRLHELIHKQHITDFDLKPGFFNEFPNQGCGGCFTELSPATWGAPERISRTNAPVSNHQQSVIFPIQAADAQPEPVSIQFKNLFPRSVSYLRHGLLRIWGRKGKEISLYDV
jgi:hypothetical protein